MENELIRASELVAAGADGWPSPPQMSLAETVRPDADVLEQQPKSDGEEENAREAPRCPCRSQKLREADRHEDQRPESPEVVDPEDAEVVQERHHPQAQNHEPGEKPGGVA
jgi:hypothetical protein